MEQFNTGMTILASVIGAGGTFLVVWGLITLGSGMKDHTGPQIQQGIWTIMGGVLILLAAYLVTTISFG